MPVTRECPFCKMEIRPDASVCPHCQRESDSWKLNDEHWWAKGEAGGWIDKGSNAAAAPVTATQTNPTAVGCLVIVVIVVAIAVYGAMTGSGSDGTFSVVSEDFTAIDEANLAVFVELKNTGDEPAEAECTIAANDSSGQVGFDIFSWDGDVDPGETFTGRANVRIEDEGAFRVVGVDIDC